MDYILFSLAAVFFENIIFSNALGTSTLLAISKIKKDILSFGICLTYFTTITSVLSFFVNRLIVNIKDIELLRPLIYVVLVGLVYIITLIVIWECFNNTFDKLRKFVHISAFNCAVFGTIFLCESKYDNFIDYLLFGFMSGIGFLFALYIISIVYERLSSEKVPISFRGYPLILIYIGILSMAFYGISHQQVSF